MLMSLLVLDEGESSELRFDLHSELWHLVLHAEVCNRVAQCFLRSDGRVKEGEW